jgi:hypothetical protein
MRLLSGADITIRYDEKSGKYTATVLVGFTSKTATADTPALAVGLAAILQAGMTENQLKKKLGE